MLPELLAAKRCWRLNLHSRRPPPEMLAVVHDSLPRNGQGGLVRWVHELDFFCLHGLTDAVMRWSCRVATARGWPSSGHSHFPCHGPTTEYEFAARSVLFGVTGTQTSRGMMEAAAACSSEQCTAIKRRVTFRGALKIFIQWDLTRGRRLLPQEVGVLFHWKRLQTANASIVNEEHRVFVSPKQLKFRCTLKTQSRSTFLPLVA